jgi:carbonic anhydrase/SulP family sulfate permease
MDAHLPLANDTTPATVSRDLTAGLVVFLVALPLCLGVALASGAPPLSGILAGVVGGVLVGLLSGSHTSVSGPAAGLTAVVAAQIAALGSFEAFQLAVVIAGLIQVALGIARAGFLAAFFPSSVIKGLLAAIGVILVLKQIPHVLGHHRDPEGDLAFAQPDGETTLSALAQAVADLHPGAAAVGLLSVAVLVLWGRVRLLRQSPLPAPLVIVPLGVGLAGLLGRVGGSWAIEPTHLVQVPVADDFLGFFGLLRTPDFTQWRNPAVYAAALTLAAVASLETLLNLEAADKLDPRGRTSPPSRELLSQGVGNVASGLVGGLPVTSVVVRSSVNVGAGARTRLAAVTHGVLLLLSVSLLGAWLNRIPLACLAAILLVTGAKLASPALVRRMWEGGRYQFAPFALTVAAIVVTDLLTGVLIGLAASAGFILWSNARRPIRRVVENHLGGAVVRVELANQVTFLNRAALARVLDGVLRGGRVLLDARGTDYVDPDVLDLIRDFTETAGPARGVEVSLLGFRTRYELGDQILYADYSTREMQDALTPEVVLQALRDGNERFRTGRRLTRDLGWQDATAAGPHPLAVVLSCIDSRTPAELVFDLGVGDVFSVRVAGNVTSREVLGSVEYACVVARVKLVLVLGHTRCGAVTAAVERTRSPVPTSAAAGCDHLDHIVREIQKSIDPPDDPDGKPAAVGDREVVVDVVARRNVARAVDRLRRESPALDRLVREGGVAIVGAMYDVETRTIEFLPAI